MNGKKMREFNINIEETLERQITVRANTLEEALDKAWRMYNSGEIVLDYTDHTATEIYEF